jgi:tryptophan synthase alpha subunit
MNTVTSMSGPMTTAKAAADLKEEHMAKSLHAGPLALHSGLRVSEIAADATGFLYSISITGTAAPEIRQFTAGVVIGSAVVFLIDENRENNNLIEVISNYIGEIKKKL